MIWCRWRYMGDKTEDDMETFLALPGAMFCALPTKDQVLWFKDGSPLAAVVEVVWRQVEDDYWTPCLVLEPT